MNIFELLWKLGRIKHIKFFQETASSSSHCFVKLPKDLPKNFWGRKKLNKIELGEFGWKLYTGRSVLNSKELVSYFVVLALHNGVFKDFLDCLEGRGIVISNPVIKNINNCYIDHQSCPHLYGDKYHIASFLADLLEYCLDNKISIHIANDNEDWEEPGINVKYIRGERFFILEESSFYIVQNGNYYVVYYSFYGKLDKGLDFKFRVAFHDEELKPKFPENIEIKITNKCKMNCPYCYENSTPDGKHANPNFVENFLDKPIEIVFGGGNPLLHPEIFNFLNHKTYFKAITVNASFLKDFYYKLPCKTIGLSYSNLKDTIIAAQKASEYAKVIVHFINGVHTEKEIIEFLEEANEYSEYLVESILILGYKDVGRGKNFKTKEFMKYENLIEISKKYKIPFIFDTLAVKQLKIKEKEDKKVLDLFFGGDDGEFSMYYDAVENIYGKSSYHVRKGQFWVNESRYISITDLFKKVKKLL